MNQQTNLFPLKLALWLCVQTAFCWFSLPAVRAAEVSRTYTYQGFDTNGNLLVEGVVTFHLDGIIKVKGDWKLKVRYKNKLKEFGPQDGTGKLVGQFNGDSIFLNLNPDEYQNNIYLDGKVTRANIFRINGKWGYYGFVGKLNEGRFRMIRKKE